MPSNPKTIPEALAWLQERFRPEAAVGVNANYQMKLSGSEGGTVNACIRAGKLEVSAGAATDPQVIFHLSADDFFEILSGVANPDLLVLEERLRIEGELSLASQMRRYFHAGPWPPS